MLNAPPPAPSDRESTHICVHSPVRARGSAYFRGMNSTAPRPPRAYRVAEALASGVTPSRVRRTGSESGFWGVRSPAGTTSSVRSRALEFAARMPDRAFFSGLTAAHLHQLPLPSRHQALSALDVAVPAGTRRVEASGIRAHHLRVLEHDIEARDTFRVTSLARTWCDLATTDLTLGELVAAGDRALWVRAPLTDHARLRLAVEEYDGRRGSRRMRDALLLLDGRADSPPESELRVAIVSSRFPRPEVNAPLHLGHATIHPDMMWPDHRVLLEYEGDHHRTVRHQWRHDIRRYDGLRRAGWTVIQATGDDYADPRRLLARLAGVLPH